MKKEFLITRPCYDNATNYLYHYANQIIKFAKDNGIKTIDLIRPRLTKKILTSMIKQQEPIFTFFNGHGSARTIVGDKINNKEEILIEENINHELLYDRLVFARACWAADSLGKACTKNNDGCFIGYQFPFSFWCDEQWLGNPLKDNLAKLFIEPSDIVAESILTGHSATEAIEKSFMASKKAILGLLRKKEEPGAIESIKILWNNMDSLKLLGNENMCFE